VRAYQEGERLAAAVAAAAAEVAGPDGCSGVGGGSEWECGSAAAGGLFLGTRAACALLAARLAMLRLLSGPLASLSQALQMCGVEMGDALALLRTRGLPADASSGVLRLVQTVCAARQQAPDPAVLGTLIAQLQGPEDVLAAWQADRQQAAEAQSAQEQEQEVQEQEQQEQQQREPHRNRGSAVAHAATCEQPSKGERSPEHRRCSPSPASPPGKRARPAALQDSERQAEREAGGRADEASAPPRLAAASVLCWVGPSSKQPERTPASDAGIERGFPPALTDAGDRFELLEALLAHGVIYAAGDEGWPPGSHLAQYAPSNAFWRVDRPVAVALERLWAQLPRPMREWLEEQGSGSGGEGGGGSGGVGGRGARTLVDFVAHRCTALRLVEQSPLHAPSAALAPGWRERVFRARVVRRLVAQLEANTRTELEALGGSTGAAGIPGEQLQQLAPRALLVWMAVSARAARTAASLQGLSFGTPRTRGLATRAPLPCDGPKPNR
jgi:hypothetical protein